jgi:hypothetical protein
MRVLREQEKAAGSDGSSGCSGRAGENRAHRVTLQLRAARSSAAVTLCNNELQFEPREFVAAPSATPAVRVLHATQLRVCVIAAPCNTDVTAALRDAGAAHRNAVLLLTPAPDVAVRFPEGFVDTLVALNPLKRGRWPRAAPYVAAARTWLNDGCKHAAVPEDALLTVTLLCAAALELPVPAAASTAAVPADTILAAELQTSSYSDVFQRVATRVVVACTDALKGGTVAHTETPVMRRIVATFLATGHVPALVHASRARKLAALWARARESTSAASSLGTGTGPGPGTGPGLGPVSARGP